MSVLQVVLQQCIVDVLQYFGNVRHFPVFLRQQPSVCTAQQHIMAFFVHVLPNFACFEQWASEAGKGIPCDEKNPRKDVLFSVLDELPNLNLKFHYSPKILPIFEFCLGQKTKRHDLLTKFFATWYYHFVFNERRRLNLMTFSYVFLSWKKKNASSLITCP